MPKKFLDANGVTHLISLLDNYPDNALLGSVIDAIEEELDSKVSIAGDTMTGSLVVNSKITSVGLDAGTGNIITTGNISGNAITSNYDITVGHGYFIIKPYSSIYDSTGEDPGIRFYYNHDRSGILADTLFANKAISATKFYGDGSGLTNLTVMTGATSSAAGVAGIVPTPAKGKQTSFLRGDGTWVVPTNTDTKVNVTLDTTTKAYLLATSTTPTSTATAVTSIADTGVYLDTTVGTLVTTGKITSVGLDAGNGAISTNNTITGSSVSITGQNGLTLSRIVDNKTLQAKLFKNASNSADYGTQIIDYSINDTTQYTRLVIRDAASTDSGKLYLTDESQNVYYIYGEHNKPTPEDIGVYPTSGGMLSGSITIQKSAGTPSITLLSQEKEGVGPARTILYKNAGSSTDNGTFLVDYVWGDYSSSNINARLVLAANQSLSNLVRLRYDDGLGNNTIYKLYGEHNKPTLDDVINLVTTLAGKSDSNHTHNYLPLTGGTLTGEISISKNAPRIVLVAPEKENVGNSRTSLMKNASSTGDSGTLLTDYVWGDGSSSNQRTTLQIKSSASLTGKLNLIHYADGGAYTTYKIYGEHNKPTAADIGAAPASHSHDYLPLAGGTLTGDLMIQLNTGIPAFSLRASEKENVGRARMMLYKEAGSTDYGTWLVDYTWDNSLRTALVLRNAATALRDRLTLRNYTGSTSTTYHLFGEHNPPAVADVDGLQTALNGKSDVNHTHFSATPTNNQVVVADGTDGAIKTSGYTIAKSVPSTAVFTDVKVTQTIKTDNVERPILTAPLAQTDTTTTTAAFSTNITANASTGALTAKNLISTADCTINSGYFTIKPYSSYYDTTGNHAGIKFYFNHDRSGFNADTLITGLNLQAKIYYMNQGLYLKTNDMGEYGRLAITTLGTAGTGSANGTNGCTSLYLGNDIPLSSATTEGANNAYGRIVMYGTGTAYTILRANPNGNRTCYLPKGAETMYLTYKPSTAAVGSSSAGVFIDANGKATVTGSSDIRLKNIEGIIPDVSKISAIKFKWNESYMNRDDKEHIGYSAQDVEEIAPFLVSEDENGYKILNYTEFLCAKIQCLEEKIKQLEEKIEKRL